MHFFNSDATMMSFIESIIVCGNVILMTINLLVHLLFLLDVQLEHPPLDYTMLVYLTHLIEWTLWLMKNLICGLANFWIWLSFGDSSYFPDFATYLFLYNFVFAYHYLPDLSIITWESLQWSAFFLINPYFGAFLPMHFDALFSNFGGPRFDWWSVQDN